MFPVFNNIRKLHNMLESVVSVGSLLESYHTNRTIEACLRVPY